MRRSTSLLAVASLALAGCVAGPPPEIATPVPELPDEFIYSPEADEAASLAQLLPTHDPAFEMFAEFALQEAPSLTEALARVEAARAAASGAGAARLPSVGASTSVTANRTNPAQFGVDLPGGAAFDTERTSYAGNLTASWEIDIFGRLKATERAALARLDAASANSEAVRITLLAEIAGAVIDWRTNDARTQALAQDLAAAERLADLAAKREEAGLAPGFDRVRAEAAASQSRSRIAALSGERARILGRLVPLTAQSPQLVGGQLLEEPDANTTSAAPVALPSLLLTHRPDVRVAAAELAAADADLAAAARLRFPLLTLSGALGLLSFDLGKLFDDGSDVYTAAGSLTAPLLDFGRIEAQIDGAAAGKRAAFAAYRGAVFNALGETEAAYGAVAGSDAQVDAARRENAELERAFFLAETRYRAGLADFLTVLEARRAADASGERLAITIGQANRARVQLWLALGGDSHETTRSINQ
ncbi:MAG: efflux transporter outer membrane subunit [Altererythrobacter sp.]|nr:efflux transporter outer membrane subunit [Altererythrobacter sp.]